MAMCVSITIASAPASNNASARSNVSLVTPTAAAQVNDRVRLWQHLGIQSLFQCL